MKISLAVLASIALVLPSGAFAQTKEEAVAYAFLGLADGATLVRGTTTMNWTETGSAPAVFEGDGDTGGHKYKIRFTVEATSDCDFSVTLEGPENMVRMGKALYAKVDLRQIDNVTVADHAVKASISGKGFCETGPTNPTCMFLDTSDLFGAVDVEAHKQAVALIRTDACRPDAG